MQDRNISAELSRVLGQTPAGTGLGQAVTAALGTGAGTAVQGNGLTEAIAQNTALLAQVRSVVQGQLDSVAENTRALVDNTTVKSSSAGSTVANVAGSFAKDALGGGLLGSLFSGLMGLFGGGHAEAPQPLTKFAIPAPVQFTAGVQGGTLGGADYGQNDQPRSTADAQSAPAHNITVNVNAMDSRSFLDHSGEIANAVRRAMLESSSLNDVIGEM